MNLFKKVALIVPSIRKESFERFCDEWRAHNLFDAADLFLVEDNPEPTFEIPDLWQHAAGGYAEHYSWKDIDQEPWAEIVPRRSDTVRSYGYWQAWKQGYDYLITLDDDCYPEPGYENLVQRHRSMLDDRTRWFNTLNKATPRGMPYMNLGNREVMVNHGLWTNVLDFDAPHQLANPEPEVYTHDNRIVPHQAYFPFCGMNWMCRREAIPLMYHLLMGQARGDVDGGGCPPECPDFHIESSLQKLPFDRFGDIWCGIIMKKICDHLGWAVSSGTPYIHHDRASNPFTNLRKEANGLEVNEWFWQRVDEIYLSSDLTTVTACYSQVADGIHNFGGEHAEYWKRLGKAMNTWSKLFE